VDPHDGLGRDTGRPGPAEDLQRADGRSRRKALKNFQAFLGTEVTCNGDQCPGASSCIDSIMMTKACGKGTVEPLDTSLLKPPPKGPVRSSQQGSGWRFSAVSCRWKHQPAARYPLDFFTSDF
jgi:hypothetical protein